MKFFLAKKKYYIALMNSEDVDVTKSDFLSLVLLQKEKRSDSIDINNLVKGDTLFYFVIKNQNQKQFNKKQNKTSITLSRSIKDPSILHENLNNGFQETQDDKSLKNI